MPSELAPPQCFLRRCRHLQGVKVLVEDSVDPRDMIVVCPAFPDGFPDAIAYGRNRHLTRNPRQVGDIVFAAAVPTSPSSDLTGTGRSAERPSAHRGHADTGRAPSPLRRTS